MGYGLHERFDRAGAVRHSSDRTFGIVFAVFFTVVALFPVVGGGPPRVWSLVVAGLFLAMAFGAPRYLAPFNRLWQRFGELLHRIMSPLILGVIFFIAVAPIALIMRVLGKDPLSRKLSSAAETYWTPRDPIGPPPQSMRNQF